MWWMLAGLTVLYLGLFRVVARASLQLRVQSRTNERLALHDALTGLPNRVLLKDRTTQALAAATRSGARVGLLLLDLDRFKEINDTLGHHCGDELLEQVGPRLRRVLREADTIARLGGDEFVVLLPDLATEADAFAVADKLLAGLHEPFVLDGVTLDVEASMGVTVAPEHGDSFEVLLQRADIAMYVAKETHTGVAAYAPELDRNSPARLSLLGDLRRGLERDELVLHYQPKAELATGLVQSVEALARWQHPQRGLLGPGEFVPLAERTGLIRPLTLAVLDAALAQARAWETDGLALAVAVNVSARCLLDLDFPRQVADRLTRHEVGAERLVIEITESGIMTDPARAQDVLTRLSELGIRLSIDDFGTGYSSLAYLKRLPVNELKIDRSFVLQMAADSNDAVIVSSSIELGRNLGLHVVAEGVEDAEVWRQLTELGCSAAQGYHLSRPLPPHQLAAWLRHRNGQQPASSTVA